MGQDLSTLRDMSIQLVSHCLSCVKSLSDIDRFEENMYYTRVFAVEDPEKWVIISIPFAIFCGSQRIL
ncbi:unnamed protein product [Fusarium graminearum]|nr:unnamed protein product [Fusarium graminearum]